MHNIAGTPTSEIYDPLLLSKERLHAILEEVVFIDNIPSKCWLRSKSIMINKRRFALSVVLDLNLVNSLPDAYLKKKLFSKRWCGKLMLLTASPLFCQLE
eukprot:Lithocolla_globosa_v1_NODE_2309_length_2056_cov_8.557721.p1 type:complete len:100 gc:universal NODE_2309_length_2056_cov_8.557721:1228-1527(+)